MIARRATNGTRHNRPRRRGVLATEFLFVVSAFLVLLLGLVGLADLVIVEQLVSEASGRGARVIALGGTEDQAREAIRAVIGPDRTDNANIVFVTESEDGTPIPPGGLIEVRVELESRHATVTRFAPVASDDLVVGRTVMQRE